MKAKQKIGLIIISLLIILFVLLAISCIVIFPYTIYLWKLNYILADFIAIFVFWFLAFLFNHVEKEIKKELKKVKK